MKELIRAMKTSFGLLCFMFSLIGGIMGAIYFVHLALYMSLWFLVPASVSLFIGMTISSLIWNSNL